MYLHWVTTLLWLRPIHTSNCGISQGLMHIIWLHPTTVPVNKKYVPFQENDRFTVNRFIKKRYYYRKETQWSRHPETKWNAQKTQTERTTDRLHSTQYPRSVKKKR